MKYLITVGRTIKVVAEVEVEADNKEEARELLWEEAMWAEDIEWEEVDEVHSAVVEIEEIS